MSENSRYQGKRWVNSSSSRENQGEKRSYHSGSGYHKDYSRSEGDEGRSYRTSSYHKDGGDDTKRSYRSGSSYHKDSTDGEKHSYRSDSSYHKDRSYGDDSRRGSYNRDGASHSGYQKRSDGYQKKFSRDDSDRSYEKKAPREDQEENASLQQAGGEDTLPFLIIGRNAVREAIKSGRSIDRILVVKEHDGSLGEIVTLAKDAKLVIRETDRKKLDELCMPFGHGGKTANHQGVVAYAAGMEYCDTKDILALAKERGEDPFVLVLDGVEDPHNLGSIIRTAECAGVHGIIIGKRRSASVTAAAVKAAAGATSYMKVAKVTNVSGALEELKRAGLWIAGADMSGRPMSEQGLNGPLAIVIGSEGNGLTKLVRETCDFLVSIPMWGHINSLNAGVAAGILIYEKKRQDAIKTENA